MMQRNGGFLRKGSKISYMLQGLSCLIMVVGGTGLGFYYSAQWRKRLELLKWLHQTMNLLKGEISLGNLPLPDAFIRISRRVPSPMADFLRSLGKKMKSQPGEPFSEIFTAEVRHILGKTCLANEDLQQLEDLGAHLGYLDRQTQLRTLDLYTHNLEDTIQELKEELPKRRKMYRSLGILGGLFLAVLLV